MEHVSIPNSSLLSDKKMGKQKKTRRRTNLSVGFSHGRCASIACCSKPLFGLLKKVEDLW